MKRYCAFAATDEERDELLSGEYPLDETQCRKPRKAAEALFVKYERVLTAHPPEEPLNLMIVGTESNRPGYWVEKSKRFVPEKR